MNERKSPEETGEYRCEKCGNVEEFIGFDDRGYPGAECECGAYDDDSEEGKECTCLVTLEQPFLVEPDGEVIYEVHSGGYDSEIGNYTRIQCAKCGNMLWEETTPEEAQA